MLLTIEAPAIQATSPAEEIEWLRLEADSDAVRAPEPDDDGHRYVWRDFTRWSADHAPKYSDRPHPDSYGADLPMRATLDPSGKPRIQALTAAEKKYLAAREASPKPIIRVAAPHPASDSAHLPLSGLHLSGGDPVRRWTLTMAEKKALAARPLRYSRP